MNNGTNLLYPSARQSPQKAPGPLISVIIPTYNAAPFLERALRSCIDSEYYRLEIIISDDGSTDNTPALIESIARTDRRAMAVLNSHCGVSATRNSALARANGSYIVLLDADDELVDGWLATCVRVLEDNPTLDGVYGSYFIHLEHSDTKERKAPPQRLPLTVMLQDNPLPINTLFLRADLYRRLGAFDVAYHTHEDWLYWLRAAYSGWRLARLDDDACIIYIHGSNASANWRSMSRGRIACLDYAEQHFRLNATERAVLRGRRATERFYAKLEELFEGQDARYQASIYSRKLLTTLEDLPWGYSRSLNATKIYLWVLWLASILCETMQYSELIDLPHLLYPIRRWSHLAPPAQHELGYA